MGAWLESKLGEFIDVDEFLRDERFVYRSGTAVTRDDDYRQSTMIWFHRDLPDETPVPGEMPIVYADDRIVVVDKPPFLSTIPRGRHVLQSATVKLRNRLGLSELTPAHRLDRVTSGLLLFTTERRWRGAYQFAFQDQQITKVYRALARHEHSIVFPATVQNHIHKVPGVMRAEVIPDAKPNAVSIIERERELGDTAIYRLTPHTGKTHQLRLHMESLGIPILGDPLYPTERCVDIDDFREPLQLLAAELRFLDPVDGQQRHFVSERTLPILARPAI